MNAVDAVLRIRRDLALIFILALLIRLLAIIPVHGPGYMDAAYSYDIALNLNHGQGFNEPFLWNYLDDPAGLPHPSHLYWMPLPTMLAWVGLKLFGESYRAAQMPFVLMAALLPLVSYWVALQVLTRADGPLLLIAIGLVWAKSAISRLMASRETGNGRIVVAHMVWLLSGYVLVMLPWFIRNWVVTGVPLPTVGTQTIWLTTYDDLFSYGRELSIQNYLAWGWANILRSKLDALWLNAQTVVAVLCMVFLVPLVVIGGWRLRRHPLFQLAGWYGALLFLAMTLVFTFPGPRGGLLHSGGALLPFIFTAGAVGLDAAVEWAAAHRRGWHVPAARYAFGIGMIGLAALVSGFLYYQGVIVGTRWREDTAYSDLVQWLAARHQLGQLVMVGDPASYWYAGGGPSIVVPNEPIELVLTVADRYGAHYLILDRNRPRPLAALYEKSAGHVRLRLVDSLSGGIHIYFIQPLEVAR
jgi:hypothetical protein